MPEGPEVKIIVDRLSFIQGRYLTEIEWDKASKYRDGIDGYQELYEYLPLMIESIHCKGKQIFFVLTSKTIKYVLNCTLGMEGRWLFEPTSHSNLNLKHCPEYLQYTLNGKVQPLSIDEEILYFDDCRHFGNLFILTEIQYQNKLSQIGPDLLTEEISPDSWLSKAKNGRIKNKQICDYLMTQKYFSGIGNYLKSEILYAAKIRPNRMMKELSDHDLLTILHFAQFKIRQSYQSKGLTIRSYIDPDGNKGEFKCSVYGKDVDPDGNKVIKDTFKDKRTTHWVSEVQV